MTKPNVVDAAVGAYRELLAHVNDWAKVAIVPALIGGVIAVIGTYVAGLIGGFVGSLVGIVFSLAAGAFAYCVNIAWFRAVNSGFTRVAMVLPLAPSASERLFLIWALGIGILPGAVISLLVGGAEGASAGAIAGTGLVGLVVSIAIIIIAVRLSFFFEDLALGKTTTPGTSFNATGPYFGSILGSVILIIIPIVIVMMIVGLILSPLFVSLGIVGLAIFQLVAVLVGAIGAALMTSVVNAYYTAA
jgi:hypothetical protein